MSFYIDLDVRACVCLNQGVRKLGWGDIPGIGDCKKQVGEVGFYIFGKAEQDKRNTSFNKG